MFEAVLFDLDGVIIDSNKGITDYWQALASSYQISLTPSDFERYIYGCPARETLDLLFTRLTSAEKEAALLQLISYESNLRYTEIPGAMAFLRALREHGIPTALVTSGEQWKVDIIREQLGIGELFTEFITADQIRNGKPDPECYLLAAQRLNKPAAKCVVFEDAVSGVAAATAAGAFCVGVQKGNMVPPLVSAGAGLVVPDFEQVQIELSESQTLSGGPQFDLKPVLEGVVLQRY
jgi:HAD superfamily hydrolase (TIGR01509 family)